MSVEDRDWYREDFKRKEKEYGGDFSIASNQKEKRQKRIIGNPIRISRQKL